VDYSTTDAGKKGASGYFCTLPYDTYTVLECHIPAEIEIESVVLSHVLSSTPVYARKLNTSLLIWMLVPVFCAYFAAMGVIFVKRKRK